jgi:selenocysteine lyase/cysteine desulfurase
MSFEELRQKMPAVNKQTYLMAAAASPLHPDAYQRSCDFQKELFETGDIHWEDHLNEMESVRDLTAQMLKVESKEIAFVSSSSFAMNLFALTVKERCKKYGKALPRVLTTEDEFPSSTIGWLKHGFEVDFVPSVEGTYPKDHIEKFIKPETGVLVSSYVEYCTGFRQSINDLVNLKKKHNLILTLNATQALGVFPLDVSEVDFVCGSVHKWLMSGIGLCVTKISKDYLEDLPLAGWLSQNDFFSMRNNILDEIHEAKALELGCGPFLQIFSVGSTLSWISKNGGFEASTKRVLSLVDYAKKCFKEESIPLLFNFDEDHQSGILMIESKNAAEEELKLIEKKVFVSARGKGLRVAIHFYNNEKDIDNFIAEFKKIRS